MQAINVVQFIAIHVLTFLGKVNGSPLVSLQAYVHNVNKHMCPGLGKGLFWVIYICILGINTRM